MGLYEDFLRERVEIGAGMDNFMRWFERIHAVEGLHLLNVMDSAGGIRIIDRVNAKMGKKIRDYARSYVVFTEHAAGLKRNYMKRVLALEGYTEEFFMKAVHVCAVFRLKEHDNKRVRLLVKTTAPR